MNFDPSPESMGSREQIWFPSDYNRIRWWTMEGQYSIIRPPLGSDAAFALGLDRDVFWAQVGRLPAKLGNDLFAEWIVYRQDLGLAVTASKIEVAVDGYYERLLEDTMEPLPSTLKAAMGIDAAAPSWIRSPPGSRDLSSCPIPEGPRSSPTWRNRRWISPGAATTSVL